MHTLGERIHFRKVFHAIYETVHYEPNTNWLRMILLARHTLHPCEENRILI